MHFRVSSLYKIQCLWLRWVCRASTLNQCYSFESRPQRLPFWLRSRYCSVPAQSTLYIEKKQFWWEQLRFYFGLRLERPRRNTENSQLKWRIRYRPIKSSECCCDTKLFAVGFWTGSFILLNTSQIPYRQANQLGFELQFVCEVEMFVVPLRTLRISLRNTQVTSSSVKQGQFVLQGT